MQPVKKDPDNHLEFAELLDSLASPGKHAEDIESDLKIVCQHFSHTRQRWIIGHTVLLKGLHCPTVT